MLISFAMICSCQKQDSPAEQQLAQRKTEVDARETALIERLNALDEKVNALDNKVKALAEKEQTTLNAGTTATGVQGQTSDPYSANGSRIWTKRRCLAKRYFLRRRLFRQLHLLR